MPARLSPRTVRARRSRFDKAGEVAELLVEQCGRPDTKTEIGEIVKEFRRRLEEQFLNVAGARPAPTSGETEPPAAAPEGADGDARSSTEPAPPPPAAPEVPETVSNPVTSGSPVVLIEIQQNVTINAPSSSARV